MGARKPIERITVDQIIIFGATFVGIFLIYVGHFNIYFNTPLTSTELRFVEIFLGFCFLLIAFVIYIFNKRFKKFLLNQ